jgi:chorismate mutase
MTQDDIIRMAREAGAMFDHIGWLERDLEPVFQRFAALVAEAELLRCINTLVRLHERQGPEPAHNYYLHAAKALRGEV